MRLLAEGYKVAREIVNPINAPGDKIGVVFENGKVIPVPGFREAYHFLQQNGWDSNSKCIKVETGMPLIMYKAIHEMNTGTCPALDVVHQTDQRCVKPDPPLREGKGQRTVHLEDAGPQVAGHHGLTESSYGSDTGDITTRSYPTDDPRIWKIKGTKIFITAGDQGTYEHTIHLVLARPDGAAAGAAGIGLYVVPKIWVNEDGSMGSQNDVTTIGVEHKMGLHAQATALFNFDDE